MFALGVFRLFVCLFGFVFIVFVCFSLRRSSGNTTGNTTLSCPSCSTRWVSLCPAGSAKNWSTAGSGTAAGAHSSAHTTETTAQLGRETLASPGPNCWRSQIVVKEVAIWKDNLGKTADDSRLKRRLSRWKEGKKEGGVSKKMVASSSWWFCPHLPASRRAAQDSRLEERRWRELQCLIITTLLHHTSSRILKGKLLPPPFAARPPSSPPAVTESQLLMGRSSSRTSLMEWMREWCAETGDARAFDISVTERRRGHQGSRLRLHVVASLDRPW